MNKLKILVFLFSALLAFVFCEPNKQIFASENLIEKQDWGKASILKTYQGNYLKYTLQENRYLWRWNNTSFPLKVYIKSQTAKKLPDYFESDVRKAFQTWQNSSGGLVSFVFVNNTNQADIVVYFIDDSLNREGKSSTLGITKPRFSNTNTLIKPVIIELVPYKYNTVYQTSGTIYLVALHEIGHSLGVMHSNNTQDIMTPNKYLSIGKLSQGDLNTLKLLYSVIPDACDKPYSEEYRNKYVTSEDIKKTETK